MHFKDYFNESYRNITDFFNDPKIRTKTLSQMIGEFEREGGIFLGSGLYAYTVTHPNWNYVAKIYEEDACYTNFVRFIYQHQQSSHFPKIVGREQKLYNKNLKKRLYLVRLEELVELKDATFIKDVSRQSLDTIKELLRFNITTFQKILKDFPTIKNTNFKKYILKISEPWNTTDWNELDTNFYQNHFYSFCGALYEYSQKLPKSCFWDVSGRNIMVRPSTGELVITDPVAPSISHPTHPYSKEKQKRLKEKRNNK